MARPTHRELFPQVIRRFKALPMDAGEVKVRNSSDVRWCVDKQGTRWVRKSVTASDLQAEAIGYLLSLQLDVRTPLAAYAPGDGEEFWLGQAVQSALHWDSQHVDLLANPDELGALLALDAIIGNRDRHERNILLAPNDDATLDVWSIDLANSLIANVADLRGAGMSPPSVENLAPGIPFDIVELGALACADRASHLDGSVIEDCVKEACWLAKCRDDETLEIDAFLKSRCANALDIVRAYLAAARSRR